MGLKPRQGFCFVDPGPLEDRELRLVLVERQPAVREKGFVPAYKFEMRVAGERVGRIDLRAGTTEVVERYGGHVGYWVDPAHRGKRLAARSLVLLVSLARAHGIDPLWITCNPDNVASRRTCGLAGATYVETVSLPEHSDMYRKGAREKCRYALSTSGMTRSRAGQTARGTPSQSS